MNQKNQKRKQKQKRLIASMGSFAVTFSLLIPPTYAVEMEQVNVPEVVTSNQAGTLSETSGVGPYLQISEIVFNSKDHSSESESYEYIELYNASNTAIALKDYKLLYNNWSVQKNEWEFTTDKILQPGEVVVVWNKKRDRLRQWMISSRITVHLKNFHLIKS